MSLPLPSYFFPVISSQLFVPLHSASFLPNAGRYSTSTSTESSSENDSLDHFSHSIRGPRVPSMSLILANDACLIRIPPKCQRGRDIQRASTLCQILIHFPRRRVNTRSTNGSKPTLIRYLPSLHQLRSPNPTFRHNGKLICSTTIPYLETHRRSLLPVSSCSPLRSL